MGINRPMGLFCANNFWTNIWWWVQKVKKHGSLSLIKQPFCLLGMDLIIPLWVKSWATTGLTKGGFYFHFKSKENLALAVIEALKECWAKEILPKLKEGKDARENLKLMFSAPGDCCNSSEGIRPTILLLNLATEMLEVNDKFRRCWVKSSKTGGRYSRP